MERFWNKVLKLGENECWNWIGASSLAGYGRFKLNGKLESPHRLSWELENNAKVPIGHDVCHSCDNPSCVNPKHLFVGTRSDNMVDSFLKGRSNPYKRARKGEESGKSKLLNNQVLEIKSLLTKGLSHKEIAKKFGVHKSAISKISTGKNWGHLQESC